WSNWGPCLRSCTACARSSLRSPPYCATRTGASQHLAEWMDQARSSSIPELKAFAIKLGQDREAVAAALACPTATIRLHTAPRHSDGDHCAVVVATGNVKRQVPRSLYTAPTRRP